MTVKEFKEQYKSDNGLIAPDPALIERLSRELETQARFKPVFTRIRAVAFAAASVALVIGIALVARFAGADNLETEFNAVSGNDDLNAADRGGENDKGADNAVFVETEESASAGYLNFGAFCAGNGLTGDGIEAFRYVGVNEKATDYIQLSNARDYIEAQKDAEFVKRDLLPYAEDYEWYKQSPPYIDFSVTAGEGENQVLFTVNANGVIEARAYERDGALWVYYFNGDAAVYKELRLLALREVIPNG